MEDNSPNKIKRETQVYHHDKNLVMKWSDIKHLELEDDDIIQSGWVDDDSFAYNGYWHGEITRMVEETDEQFEKRIANNERDAKWAKERRYQNYLNLKKEFENEDNN